ncbi:receptor-type tyrosine-protein phosphatase alpha-like isoform X2 [Oscarella lobularis]|uniref:receptor-type tyrosine-protein phosphatase alpha-like isoform X2 n=1 Tax=Oscarella lobularis TaxID=121494 RepID=UPI003313C9FD
MPASLKIRLLLFAEVNRIFSYSYRESHSGNCSASKQCTTAASTPESSETSIFSYSIGTSAAVLCLLILIFVLIILKKRQKNSQFLDSSSADEMALRGENESALKNVAGEDRAADRLSSNTCRVQDAESTAERLTEYAKITAVKLPNFARHVANLLENDGIKLFDEFQSMGSVGESKSVSLGKAKENAHKNRYKSVVPYDDNRVTLSNVHGMSAVLSDYINASYVDAFRKPKGYVACQGPLTETCSDMWRMVWAESATNIVMLCHFIENGRTQCEQYWNDERAQVYDGLCVKVVEIQRLANYTVRKIELFLKQKRTIKHFHFTSWPDQENPEHLCSLLGMMYQIRRDSSSDRMIVHCSDGVGRTGTFLAILNMISRVDAEKSLDVRGLIGEMRTKRMEMVQTVKQYAFVYTAILDYIKCRQTEVHVSKINIFSKCIPDGVTEQFRLLEDVCPKLDRTECLAAPLYNLVLTPPDASRFVLRCRGEAGDLAHTMGTGVDYVNASYVDSYYKRKGFIVTQYPMKGAVADFWKMIFQENVVTVVNLTQQYEYKPYWAEAGSVTHGLHVITFQSLSSMPGYSATIVKVTKGPISRDVRLFHFFGWPDDDVPREPQNLVRLMQEADVWQQQNGSPSIVIHCSTGIGRSGGLCAAWNACHQVDYERVMNILHAAKLVRSQRPGIILTLKYYQSVWLVVVSYMRLKEIYVNVQKIGL